MAEIMGVVKLVPVPKLNPPVEASYQLIVPEDAVAPSVTVPFPQWLFDVVPVIVGAVVTVVVMLLLVIVEPVQLAVLGVSVTVTLAPLWKGIAGVKVVVVLFRPTFTPLTLHWY